jgi:hypothetical protein
MTSPKERIEQLIEKAEAVLRTHRPNPPGVIGFPTLDEGPFTEWRTQTLAFLTRQLGSGHTYVSNFERQVKRGFPSSVQEGIGILRAVREDIEELQTEVTPMAAPLVVLEQLCERFHLVARQLRSRREGRATLSVHDEYDAQDLLHALLFLHFEDVRAEEWSPSYAGKSSRLDFLLKREQIVVEVKKTRESLGARELGTQLIEDIGRYQSHPDCRALVCFVYDPEGLVANPRGLEADLGRGKPFPVKVYIRPR